MHTQIKPNTNKKKRQLRLLCFYQTKCCDKVYKQYYLNIFVLIVDALKIHN